MKERYIIQERGNVINEIEGKLAEVKTEMMDGIHYYPQSTVYWQDVWQF